MGSKKLALGLMTLLLVSMISFQNCGKYVSLNGNGDPYEGYGTTDNTTSPTNDVKQPSSGMTQIIEEHDSLIVSTDKKCVSPGLIKELSIQSTKIHLILHFNDQDFSTDTNYSNQIPNELKIFVNTPDGKVHNIKIGLADVMKASKLSVEDMINSKLVFHPDLICQ